MPFDLLQIIEPALRSHPERTAMVGQKGYLFNYGQISEVVDSFAQRATQAGIRKGAHVAILELPLTWRLCMMFALSKLGAVCVPDLGQGSPVPNNFKIDFRIVPSNSVLSGPGIIKINAGWMAPLADAPPTAMAGFATEDEVSLIMGTSGTTGSSKLLGFSHARIEQWVDDKNRQYGPLDGRTLLFMPPSTVFGLTMALLTLRTGGQIVWRPPTDRAALAMLAGGQVDEIIATPAAYSRWVQELKADGTKLQSIRRCVMTGGPASKVLIKSVQEYFCRNLINNYGSSELGTCAWSHVDDVASIPDSVGKIADWVEVRICDDAGNELPRGTTGLLQFRLKPGHQRAPYLEELTGRAKPSGSWFDPGDVGTVTANDILCVQGRATDLINIGGNKFAPSYVEDLVSHFLGPTEMVCAFGLPGPNGFDDVAIAVHARNSERIEALRTFLKETRLPLGRFLILAVTTFPQNEFGKIDRLKLRETAARVLKRPVMTRSRPSARL